MIFYKAILQSYYHALVNFVLYNACTEDYIIIRNVGRITAKLLKLILRVEDLLDFLSIAVKYQKDEHDCSLNH